MASKKIAKRNAAISMLLAFVLAVSMSTVLIKRTAAQTTYYVDILDFAFVPSALTIVSGDTVVWTNNDPVIYMLWFTRVSDGTTYLLSDPIGPGETWSYTFTEVVDLQYFDLDRLWMTGFLTVNPSPVRDVAVTDVRLRQTVVGQGFSTKINVTVQNQGELTETFNVTLNRIGSARPFKLTGNFISGWNGTIPGPTITVNQYDTVILTLTSADVTHNFGVDYNGNGVPDAGEPLSPNFSGTIIYRFFADVVGSFTYYCYFHPFSMFGTFVVNPTPVVTETGRMEVSLLTPGETRLLIFQWDVTTAIAKAYYIITAVADTLPGETDTADNTFVDGTLIIAMPCDWVGSTTTPPAPPDGKVDFRDVFWLLKAYGSDPSKPNWNPNIDVAGSTTTPPAPPDNRVDFRDVFWLLKNYGKVDP